MTLILELEDEYAAVLCMNRGDSASKNMTTIATAVTSAEEETIFLLLFFHSF